jgi:ubiquinone/menaquinone biosynthesis C-methylase UbiE
MKEPISNLELSYAMQRESFTRLDDRTRKIEETWFQEDTVDYWRHYRMMIPVKPLLDHWRNDAWLTIGDGRFGLDSIRLKKIQPALHILPTDLSTLLLQEAKDKKLIAEFREENAEHLSFPDNSFDFTFCKESYHHFPRPYIALYEMLRVARKGVVLVEPNERRDKMLPDRLFSTIRNTVKRLVGKPVLHAETWNFEMSGNYIYSVSKNEIEKVCLGLQLPTAAFHYYNDYYEEGVEFQKAVPGNAVFERVKRKIASSDLRCKLGMHTHQGIIAIIFKESPGPELRADLKKTGFKIIDIPVNPYMKKRKESL